MAHAWSAGSRSWTIGVVELAASMPGRPEVPPRPGQADPAARRSPICCPRVWTRREDGLWRAAGPLVPRRIAGLTHDVLLEPRRPSRAGYFRPEAVRLAQHWPVGPRYRSGRCCLELTATGCWIARWCFELVGWRAVTWPARLTLRSRRVGLPARAICLRPNLLLGRSKWRGWTRDDSGSDEREIRA